MLGLFGMIFLGLLGILGNSSPTSATNVYNQISKIQCPMPAISGLWNNTGTIVYQNATYNYAYAGSRTLTLDCSEIHTIDDKDYNYGIFTIQPFFTNGTGFQFGVPVGYGYYISDAISELFVNKGGAIGTIIAFFLTPVNFSILGYTISDLSGIALMFIIALYAVSYLFISAMLFKLFNPFGSSS
jgi:hypothetical protein